MLCTHLGVCFLTSTSAGRSASFSTPAELTQVSTPAELAKVPTKKEPRRRSFFRSKKEKRKLETLPEDEQ